MSQSCPMARHCMPQKQTHQIAITALRSAASASGGFGPDRIGRVPSAAMTASSASTSSTKASTSANASHGPVDVCAGRTAVPIVAGLGAVDNDHRDRVLSFWTPSSIPLSVVVRSAQAGSGSLQTDTKYRWPANSIQRSGPACSTTSLRGRLIPRPQPAQRSFPLHFHSAHWPRAVVSRSVRWRP
jgi:hypothetical protein